MTGYAVLLEPEFMLAFGVKNIKIYTNFGLSIPVAGLQVDPSRYGMLYFPYFATVGITVQLFPHIK